MLLACMLLITVTKISEFTIILLFHNDKDPLTCLFILDAFTFTLENYGHIDILVNNAGICNDAIWEKEVAVNVVSKHYLITLYYN